MFLSALLLVARLAAAQTVDFVIWGQVILPDGDMAARKGIEVRLELRGADVLNVMTDSDGRFQFRNLNQATYTVYINLEGYMPIRQDVMLRIPAGGGTGAAITSYTEPRVTLYLRRGASDMVNNTTRESGAKPSSGATPPAVFNAELLKRYAAKAVSEFQQGLTDSQKGKADNAASHFSKAIALEPKFAEAHLELGTAKQVSGRTAEAEKSFRTAVELAPESSPALTRLGGVLLDKARALERNNKGVEAFATYNEAADVLDQATRKDLQSAEAHYLLGSALFKLNELPGAEANLRDALKGQRPIEDARLMLVNVYMKQKRFADALTQLDAYLTANPNSPQRLAVEQMQTTIKSAIKP